MSRIVLIACLAIASAAARAGESHAAPKAKAPLAGGTCAACHTSLAALDAAKAPGTDAGVVLVSEKFARSAHANRGCASCHGGDPKATAKAAAHRKVVANPVLGDAGARACGQCHTDIVARARSSLHFTSQGLKSVWFKRLGADEATRKAAKVGWKGKSCVDCHADCGTCHVKAATLDLPWEKTKKGLFARHEFQRFEKREDTEKACYRCHLGSITDPNAGFSKYDVHRKAGMGCMSCHGEREIHGDGKAYDTMIHSGAVTTECVSCHGSLAGRWHSEKHLAGASCQSCHTMPYRVCYECHGWGASDPKSPVTPMFRAEYTIKLGYANHKVTTLMKAPVDGKMVYDDGSPEIPAQKMATFSTWYPGVPHSVVRPKPSQELCDRCHGPGTALLKQSDLQYPEHERQQLVTPLPAVDASR